MPDEGKVVKTAHERYWAVWGDTEAASESFKNKRTMTDYTKFDWARDRYDLSRWADCEASEPSVDLEAVTEPIDCCEHKLKLSECDRIYEEFGIEKGTDLYVDCNMWLLNQGPQLVEG